MVQNDCTLTKQRAGHKIFAHIVHRTIEKINCPQGGERYCFLVENMLYLAQRLRFSRQGATQEV
jgi:hypothetical protein